MLPVNSLPSLLRQASHQCAIRCFAAAAIKPNIKLLSKLRQETEVSITKAKEALVKNDNDYEKALAWLANDAQVSGAKKAQKVAGRVAAEGLISIATIGAQGAPSNRSTIIELNCETDFVSRNDVFKNLASRIAATSLLLHDVSSTKAIENLEVDSLLQAPLMPHPDEPSTEGGKTVHESILEVIGKLGENITLRRAAVVTRGISAGYVHGGDASTGKMGGLAVVEAKSPLDSAGAEAVAKAARQVARQVVGFSPTYLNEADVPAEELKAQDDPESFLSSQVLSKQSFILKPDQTVAQYVDTVTREAGVKEGASVIDFVRWQVGEGIEKKATDFASEVQKAAQGN